MSDDTCGCIKCTDARSVGDPTNPFAARRNPMIMPEGFRYACEQCGNKRCPHHSDHELACTRSNEPGQIGSVFT